MATKEEIKQIIEESMKKQELNIMKLISGKTEEIKKI